MSQTQPILSTKQPPREMICRLPLSYPLSPNASYPQGGQPTRVVPVSRLDQGDIANTYRVEFWNHIGTHIDGPAHMTEAGPFANYCPPTGLFMNTALVVDIECPDSKLIEPGDLRLVRKELPSCEMLLLRTGFSLCRQSDPQRYTEKNPGISHSFARFVAESCPKLICIGIDAISFAAAEHMAEGIEAHKVFFKRRKPVLLIEDMNLACDLTNLQRVIVIPFLIEEVDSCPCTVVAEVLRPVVTRNYEAS